MLSQLKSIALKGLDGEVVSIEVDIHRGLPSFSIVGLADAAVQESRERVRASIKNAGFEFPRQKLIVNLAPAGIKKQGPRFDIAIAMGVLSASGQVDLGNVSESVLLGELGFTGDVRPIHGILPSICLAHKKGIKAAFVPEENAQEAALVEGIVIYPIRTLQQLVEHFSGSPIEPYAHTFEMEHQGNWPEAFDFLHIKGQEYAKRSLEIAAAGGHNILMVGPPGSGKTMLSKALSTILPPLTKQEILEVTQIYSVCGLTNKNAAVVYNRPFRAVHHTASGVAIVGGGNPPRPGEISLAHRGVLFLDEFAEFSGKTLEVMRQPLEDGIVTVSRSSGSSVFPARFMLVAAMNPTPSGFAASDPRCTNTAYEIQRYQKKISGPILDRIDMHLQVPHIPFEKLSDLATGESSAQIRERVISARIVQKNRFIKSKIGCNADMTSSQVKKYCPLPSDAEDLLKAAVSQMELSGRAYFRILKLARTIADLENCLDIELHHIAEAIGFRPQGLMG